MSALPARILMIVCMMLWLKVDQASGQGRSSDRFGASIPTVTAAEARISSFEVSRKSRLESPLKGWPLRSVGPTIMSGRVVDLEVSPVDPTVFYVAYATGGLWRTESNGTAFESLFDGQPTAGIGDIAVRWGEKDVIYVGTGESNSSRSAIQGAGIYRSRDGGVDWDYLGLAETHSIGKVLLSPADTNVIFVAALGHLYSKNRERGVFKTTDGGATWRPVLQIDDSTGVVDVVMHPKDPDILFAAAWHRSRKAWNFVEGGRSSGIYRSDDGGEHWRLISTKKSGFPTGRTVGRIGLAISTSAPSTLYAVVDNQAIVEDEKELPTLSFEAVKKMSSEAFLKHVESKDLEEFLDHYDFPDDYDVTEVLHLMKAGDIVPSDLTSWVGDRNRRLYDTEVVGCEVYRTNDGGEHWWRTNEMRLENVCESYGYYFGRIAIDPLDVDRIYLSGVPLLKSFDGGATFHNIGRENVHVDHHALWVSQHREGHLLNGNDGGLNLSYDGGETWFKLNAPAVGQFYTVNFDFAEPYNVYGGLQDNGVWFGPSSYEASSEWHGEGRYPYQRLLGGDGMMVEVSQGDDDPVYAGKQFGEYYRIAKGPSETVLIKPHHRFGEEPLRFNWTTPIHLSVHNDRILYLGSQKVHRSMDRGDSWQDLSGDLTQGERTGDVPFGTLTVLVESPLRFGVLFAGSDDGLIHVSKDGGTSWTLVSDDLPPDMWVSRIEPSRHVVDRLYVSLNGARWDVMDAMTYVSEDLGSTWSTIGDDLPMEPVNVIREDPINEDVLYVGTDRGLYVSIDRGRHFVVASSLPVVPVHDLKIHPRDGEIVVGTHGRSIFTGDVAAIQELRPEVMRSDLFVFEVDTVWYDREWGNSNPAWDDPEVPNVAFVFWAAKKGKAQFAVMDKRGREIVTFERVAQYGLNYVHDDLVACEDALIEHLHEGKKHGVLVDEDFYEARDNGRRYLPPGSYEVNVKLHSTLAKTPLIVSE